MTRRDLQRSIGIRLKFAIYCKSWWYTLQTYLRMDSVQMIKKDGFLKLLVFTIVKITSTDKEISVCAPLKLSLGGPVDTVDQDSLILCL